MREKNVIIGGCTTMMIVAARRGTELNGLMLWMYTDSWATTRLTTTLTATLQRKAEIGRRKKGEK